jgi:hypothetical protein
MRSFTPGTLLLMLMYASLPDLYSLITEPPLPIKPPIHFACINT